MTTLTAPGGAAPRTAPSPTVATTRWLLRQHLRVGSWAVAILVIAVAATVLVLSRFFEPELSVVQFARQAFVWFPFSVAIMTATGFMNVHVAAGLTRRTLGRASLAVALTMAAFYVAVMTVGLQLERVLYDALGWSQRVVDEQALFTDSSQVGWIVLDLGLVFTAAQLCGLLVGIVYYRGGGWWGTLTLPLTVGPILLVSPVLTTSLLDPLSQAARVPISVGALVAVAAVYLLVLRTAPVRPVTT